MSKNSVHFPEKKLHRGFRFNPDKPISTDAAKARPGKSPTAGILSSEAKSGEDASSALLDSTNLAGKACPSGQKRGWSPEPKAHHILHANTTYNEAGIKDNGRIKRTDAHYQVARQEEMSKTSNRRNALCNIQSEDEEISKHLGEPMVDWVVAEESRGNKNARDIAKALMEYSSFGRSESAKPLDLSKKDISQLPPTVAHNVEQFRNIYLHNNPIESLPSIMFTGEKIHSTHWSGHFLALGPHDAVAGSDKPPTKAEVYLCLTSTPVAEVLNKLPRVMDKNTVFSVFAVIEELGINAVLEQTGPDGRIDLQKIDTMYNEMTKRIEAQGEQ